MTRPIDPNVGPVLPTGSAHPPVLLAAPTGSDNRLLCAVLEEHGFACHAFFRLSELAERIAGPIGALILAEESLDPDELQTLGSRLATQADWSDLPVIVLTVRGESPYLHPSIETLSTWTGNISLLERPLRLPTLLSAVRVALRARARQYQVRDTLHALRRSEQHFRDLADAMPQIVWTASSDGAVEYMNQRGLAYAGRAQVGEISMDWRELLHEEDRERCLEAWEKALGRGDSFECEARLRKSASGEYHWHLGRAGLGAVKEGEPARWYGTWTDIEVQKRTQAQLDQARRELEQLNRAKDRFFATLSHELRAPLTPALFIAAALQESSAVPPELREDIEMLKRNIQLETRLIDDLLDMSRIVHGKLALHLRRLDLHKVLENCIRSAEIEQVPARRVELAFRFGAREHHVECDEPRLEQIFRNLLRNAVKFTPAGGRVLVETGDGDAGAIRVSVSDTGVGIPPERLPSIFNPFEQGGAAVTRSFGGLGLGLAIAKGLVESHGGRIRAESEGEGHGACFTVELSTAGEAGPRQSESQPGPATRSNSLRILLVEDHPDTVRILSRLLQRESHQVVTASSCEEARKLAAAESIDLVLSDLGLPDGSGHELMRDLHQRFGLRGIALSGFGTEEDIHRSRAAGFVAHLTKPVEWHSLRAAIAECARSRSGIPLDI